MEAMNHFLEDMNWNNQNKFDFTIYSYIPITELCYVLQAFSRLISQYSRGRFRVSDSRCLVLLSPLNRQKGAWFHPQMSQVLCSAQLVYFLRIHSNMIVEFIYQYQSRYSYKTILYCESTSVVRVHRVCMVQVSLDMEDP